MATKTEIDQWIASQGGPDAVAHAFEDVELPDPRGMRNLPDGSENPDYDRAFKDKKISTRRETWTNKTTGAAFSAVRTPFQNDVWEDIKQTPDTRAAPTTAATAKPAGGREGPEGTPDGNGGFDNTRPRWVVRDAAGNEVWARPLTDAERQRWEKDKNGGKTDAEVAAANTPQSGEIKKPVEGRPGWTSITRSTVQGGRKTEETVFVGPDGKEVRTLPDKPPTASERVGKPTGNTRQRTANGQSIKEVEYVLPDGTKEWRAQTAPDSSTTPDPTGAPPPSFTVGDAAKDLQAYDQWLADQVRTGKLTVARADQLREQRRKLWEVGISESQGIVNTQQTEAGRQTTERGQTLQDLGNRRTSATGIANQASGDFMPLATKLGAGGGGADLMQAIADARINAQDFVTMTGANRMVPVTQPGPALSAVNNMPLPGQRAGLLNPRAPFLAPPAAPVTPPPDAATLEAARQATMATNRAATAPLLAPPPPTAGEPGGPPLAPGPVLGDPRPAAAVNPPSGDAQVPNPPAPNVAPYPGPVPGQDPTVWTPPPSPAPGSGIPGNPDYQTGLPPGTSIIPQAPAIPQESLVPDGRAPAWQQPAPPEADPMDEEIIVRYWSGQELPVTRREYESWSPTKKWQYTIVGPRTLREAPKPPAAPVNQTPVDVPYPTNPGAQSMAPQRTPGFLSAMRPGTQAYDPTPSVQRMIADPNWDNEAVKRAYEELYGRPLQIA